MEEIRLITEQLRLIKAILHELCHPEVVLEEDEDNEGRPIGVCRYCGAIGRKEDERGGEIIDTEAHSPDCVVVMEEQLQRFQECVSVHVIDK